MRIGMVSEHASPLATLGGADAGGQNVHVAALSRALAAEGHQVTVYTRRDDPEAPDEVPFCEGVSVVHVPAGPAQPIPKDELLPYMPELGERLGEFWNADPPDVVHSHFWMSALAALTGRAGLDIPVVHTFHALGTVKRRYQGDQDTSPPERLELERAICRDVDHIIATCSDEVRELRMMGARPSKVSVIPCGVDTSRFVPDGPVVKQTSNGRPYTLLAVGRMVERKGFDQVIEALPGIPEAELLIAGGPAPDRLFEDAEAVRLRDVAREHGVEDRVSLLGSVPQEQMPALIRSADLVVCTPWYEPFGIVPLEAMACGRPVVASAVGGLTDTVLDGTTGVLVPPNDPVRLAGVLRELLADPDRRRRLGEAGIERAQVRYQWSQVGKETADVYAALLAPALREVAYG